MEKAKEKLEGASYAANEIKVKKEYDSETESSEEETELSLENKTLKLLTK